VSALGSLSLVQQGNLRAKKTVKMNRTMMKIRSVDSKPVAICWNEESVYLAVVD
jgi:hypothetical protein